MNFYLNVGTDEKIPAKRENSGGTLMFESLILQMKGAFQDGKSEVAEC